MRSLWHTSFTAMQAAGPTAISVLAYGLNLVSTLRTFLVTLLNWWVAVSARNSFLSLVKSTTYSLLASVSSK